jgi:hypothetical protein
MSLPLMPGSEPIPEKAPEPSSKAQAMAEAYGATPAVGNRLRGTTNGALLGCDCEACQRLRIQDHAARLAVPPPPVFNWESAPQPSDVIQGRYTLDRDANACLAGEARWLRPSTGELFNDAACQERCNSSMTPRADGTWASRGQLVWEAVPVNQNAGRIRGRYDFTHSQNPQDGFHGMVRWREPGTLYVFDEEGRRQWTYTRELPGGILEDDRGRRWVPTEV